jgi:hypothetical protein
MQPKKTPFGSCHYRTHDGIHVSPDCHSTIILMHRTLCLRAFPVPYASFPCYEGSFSEHDNSGPPLTVYPYNHIVRSPIKRRRTYAVFHTTTSGLDAVSSNKTSRRRLIVSGCSGMLPQQYDRHHTGVKGLKMTEEIVRKHVVFPWILTANISRPTRQHDFCRQNLLRDIVDCGTGESNR